MTSQRLLLLHDSKPASRPRRRLSSCYDTRRKLSKLRFAGARNPLFPAILLEWGVHHIQHQRQQRSQWQRCRQYPRPNRRLRHQRCMRLYRLPALQYTLTCEFQGPSRFFPRHLYYKQWYPHRSSGGHWALPRGYLLWRQPLVPLHPGSRRIPLRCSSPVQNPTNSHR